MSHRATGPDRGWKKFILAVALAALSSAASAQSSLQFGRITSAW